MEGEGDSRGSSDGGVVNAYESEEHVSNIKNSHIEGDNIRSVNYNIHSNLLGDRSGLIVADSISDKASPEPHVNHGWGQVESKNIRYDHVSNLSPFSNVNSKSSEREIIHEPVGTDYESTYMSRVVSAYTTDNNASERESMLNKEVAPLTESVIGPSEEREDISDEELEPDSWAAENVQEGNFESTYDSDSPSKALETATDTPLSPSGTEDVAYDNDVHQSPLCDGREIIDLKLEDAAGKSDSQEDLRESKGANEDLETVSDDELSEVALTGDVPVDSAFKLIEGGEQVSSSEDECPASPDSTYASLQQVLPIDKTNKLLIEGSEFPYGNIGSSGLTYKIDEISSSQLSSEPPGSLSLPLAPMEAEPISDEEDLGHADASPVDVEGGEAGEIQSPVDIRSPASFQEQSSAGLLGEVEPISADESSDTDGELPSGDEDSLPKTENGANKSNSNFLESIDSEEEGDLGSDLSHKQLLSNTRCAPTEASRSFPKRNAGGYMETISDEDDSMSAGVNARKQLESTVKSFEETHSCTSPVNKDTEPEKRQAAANFNEHQEELDYEENEGDDGEGKSEDTVKLHEKKDIKEEGEHGEGGGSDRDEGELSDDDCEEGEIKEPGSKKPFVKPMCRFFQRGNCTWGVNCRFLHPGINDKGNYQMIEIPGFKPAGIRSRIGVPGAWPEQAEELIELPPPPVPDVPPVETAWERGLRIAKEQRKKASERKEQESDFEEKRLNLSVDEEKELNKENERMPKIIPKDPYYDQHGLEEDSYYNISRNPWQTGHYENFEVRYNRETSFSPPYREKPPMLPPPPRFNHPYSPPVDKFGRDRIERREPFRQEMPPVIREYPSAIKRPDEWTDPWRRSKSPQNQKRKVRSRSRGRRTRRSVSDSSNSSRSSSGSSSGSSRSSRTFNSSTGSSSRSRSPEPAPPGVERHDRYVSPSREPPRSSITVRGSGGYNNYDQGQRRMGRGYDHNRGANNYNQRGGGNRGNSGGGGGGGGFYNNYGNMGGGPAGGYPEREMRDRVRDDRPVRNRARSPPDRPLPYVRPRPKSASSRSSSSRSRSRSRGRATSSRSRSRSSSGSSRSSSSSSSSAGSADSEHLYRDLGSPSKNPRGPAAPKRKRTNSHKDHPSGKSPQLPGQQGPPRRQGPSSQLPVSLDHIPHPRDPKPPLPPPSSGRPESKYASRNAPQAPVKAKDPLKVMGQKSNIKLTLLPKQQQSSLGSRPNPLDSPPHKRRLSELDTSPVQTPPAKRLNLPVPQTALRMAIEKAAKIQIRQEKGKSPPPALIPQSLPSSSALPSSAPRARAAVSPQKQPASIKARATEQAVAKPIPKAPSAANQVAPAATAIKAKKSMSSRREELLKQLKAVEDAIARKKSKIQ